MDGECGNYTAIKRGPYLPGVKLVRKLTQRLYRCFSPVRTDRLCGVMEDVGSTLRNFFYDNYLMQQNHKTVAANYITSISSRASPLAVVFFVVVFFSSFCDFGA